MHPTTVKPGLSSDHGSTIPQQLISSHLEKPSKASTHYDLLRSSFDTWQCCRVPAFQSRLAHRQHTNTVTILFRLVPTHTRRLGRRSLLSHCFSFPAKHVPMWSPASISQQGIVVAAVLDVHDDVAPSIQSTSLEGSFDRGLLHLQLDPLLTGKIFFIL